MKLKICGMKDPQNLRKVVDLGPDYVGFIFHDPSARRVSADIIPVLAEIPRDVCKVGVFVNHRETVILDAVSRYDLQAVQLHGQESPELCRNLQARGLEVIKAFAIGPFFDFEALAPYKAYCDLFLFDAKGKLPGGNGTRFDWTLLQLYDNSLPFFLSGGLTLAHLDEVRELEGMNLYGLDVNSGFEQTPGIKDIEKLRTLTQILRPV